MNRKIVVIVLLVKKNIHGDYFALSEKCELSHKAPKFKIGDRVRITKY